MRFINAIEKFTEWQSLRVKEGTHISYENMLKHFCFFVNNKDVERVTTDDITRWFYLMEDMRYNQNTARSKAIALRRFFEYLKMRDYKVLDFRLIQVPKKTIKQPHAATKEEYEKLMKNFNGNRKIDFRNKALVELYWDTGARNSEILSLNVSDLDLVNRRAIIKTKKALNHVREISWTPDTNESIKNWLEIKNKMKKLADEDALFISILGRKRGQRLTISGVCCIMKRILKSRE
jgi:integrase/recombinase XerC